MFPFVASVAISSIVAVVVVVLLPVAAAADVGIAFVVCFHAEMIHFLAIAFETKHAVYPDVFAASMVVLIFPLD